MGIFKGVLVGALSTRMHLNSYQQISKQLDTAAYYFVERLTSFCHTLEKYGRLQASGGCKQNLQVFSLYPSLATRKGPFFPTTLSSLPFPSWSRSQPVWTRKDRFSQSEERLRCHHHQHGGEKQWDREKLGRSWEITPSSSQDEQKFLFVAVQVLNDKSSLFHLWHCVTFVHWIKKPGHRTSSS